MKRRHLVIPDAQIGPGKPTEHIAWAAAAVVEYCPDVIVVLGDWWDMHSLNAFDGPGSASMEGARYRDDVAAGNAAFAKLVAPMQRRRSWQPECHFLFGNHEHRIERAVCRDPKFEGVIGLDDLDTQSFERHGFLEIVELDGIRYSHYFQNTHSGKPIGGSITNRLNKIGYSFVQGHEQGFLYASVPYPGNLVRHGLVAGSFYLHDEEYRGPQGKFEWRGIVVLNQVENGNYDVMPLSMEYLREKFGKSR